MKKFISVALAALLLAVSLPAQAQSTKAQMTTEIDTNLPDNTTGLITPSVGRTTLNDMNNSWQQATQIRSVTAGVDTLVLADYGHVIVYNNAGGVAVSIVQATGSFATYNVFVKNIGVGAVTITPTASTINGAASLVLAQNQGAWIVSDGANYELGPTVYASSIFGSQIATNTVANSNLAQAGANTIKGNWTGATANIADNSMPSCSDTAGNHLNYVSGSGITCGTTVNSGGFSNPTVQTFTSGSATYNPTVGTRRIRVRMVGGGGGGAGATANLGSNGTGSFFGSWTAVFGGGGSANAGSGGNGGSGGVNGTGTLIVRLGGGNGQGGTGTGGVISAPGGAGGVNKLGGAGSAIQGGAGGNGVPNTGAGGAGGGSTASSNTGGGGGSGEYVEFWVFNPSSTSYGVGAGGNGGAAGGTAGGNGGAGIIIVEEYSTSG